MQESRNLKSLQRKRLFFALNDYSFHEESRVGSVKYVQSNIPLVKGTWFGLDRSAGHRWPTNAERKTAMNKSFQFPRLVRPAMLWAACGLLALTSSAQAVYVELADDGAYHEMSVRTETQIQKINISIFGGGTMDFAVTKNVYEFTDGPVMLRAVMIQGSSAPIMLNGLDDTTWLTKNDAEWVPKLITSIETDTFGFHAAQSKIGVEIDPMQSPSSPIPEPGAALLFAAGLGVVSAGTRRSD